MFMANVGNYIPYNNLVTTFECWWMIWDAGDRYYTLKIQQYNEKSRQHNDSSNMSSTSKSVTFIKSPTSMLACSVLLTPMSLHHVKKLAALSLAKNVPTFALVVNFGGSSWFEIISHNRVATLHATIPVCKIVKISSGANFSGARSISNHSAISS